MMIMMMMMMRMWVRVRMRMMMTMMIAKWCLKKDMEPLVATSNNRHHPFLRHFVIFLLIIMIIMTIRMMFRGLARRSMFSGLQDL